ncbi:6922_t:CDS:2, partial [Racocetra fulgida]
LSVYTELFNILQHLDLGTIEPEMPIASGVIDLTGNEDIFTKLLTLKTKQILSRHSFHNNELPNQIGAMLDEFVSSYSELRTDFDLALMRPISFPQGEMSLATRRILMTTFDLLEGFKSSQSRKNRMSSINLGKKPDLQVLLKLDMEANELVLVEISRLFPEPNKEILDWKKLVRICKDCFDERYNIFFENREDTSSEARLIYCELEKIPVLGIQVIGERIFVSMLDLFEGVFYRVYRICEITIPLRISTRQVVEEFLRSCLKLRAIVEEIVGMSVSIKDEINLLPTCEERTPSTSMMSTTYSPPRNS